MHIYQPMLLTDANTDESLTGQYQPTDISVGLCFREQLRRENHSFLLKQQQLWHCHEMESISTCRTVHWLHFSPTETTVRQLLTSVRATSSMGARASVPWKSGTQSTHKTSSLWLSFFFSCVFSATSSPLTAQWGYLAACRSILQYAWLVSWIGMFLRLGSPEKPSGCAMRGSALANLTRNSRSKVDMCLSSRLTAGTWVWRCAFRYVQVNFTTIKTQNSLSNAGRIPHGHDI